MTAHPSDPLPIERLLTDWLNDDPEHRAARIDAHVDTTLGEPVTIYTVTVLYWHTLDSAYASTEVRVTSASDDVNDAAVNVLVALAEQIELYQ